MQSTQFFRVYVVPAAVFQAVIFGGAYGTGREIVEFITRHGAIGGLGALAIIAACFGLALALSFELARIFRVYDYRSFFRVLIGPAWVLYEVLFVLTLVLVLAVNASAAGTVLGDAFGIPVWSGIALLVIGTVLLNAGGREIVQKSMAFWSVLLIVVLVVYCAMVLGERFADIAQAFRSPQPDSAWALNGLQYALYNLGAVPVLLYCATGIQSRSEAVAGGFFAGFVGVLPAVIFHVTFLSGYPEVTEQSLPTYWMIDQLSVSQLLPVYVVVLFGMIVQTAVGLVQGLNERIDHWLTEIRGIKPSRLVHGSVAAVLLALSLVLAGFGIVALIARGYGTIAWGYLALYLAPLLTLGVYKIIRSRQ